LNPLAFLPVLAPVIFMVAILRAWQPEDDISSRTILVALVATLASLTRSIMLGQSPWVIVIGGIFPVLCVLYAYRKAQAAERITDERKRRQG